jgi:hypothetical protein
MPGFETILPFLNSLAVFAEKSSERHRKSRLRRTGSRRLAWEALAARPRGNNGGDAAAVG